MKITLERKCCVELDAQTVKLLLLVVVLAVKAAVLLLQ